MLAKQKLLSALVVICVVFSVCQAVADELVTVNCDPSKDSYEIRYHAIYNEAGEGIVRSKVDDPPHKNGTYDLYDLVIWGADANDPVITERKMLKKTCRLSAGTFLAKITPWKYGYRSLGECGAAELSIELSLSKELVLYTSNLVFSDSCHSDEFIDAILIRGMKEEIVVSAKRGEVPIEKVFSLKRRALITRADVFPHSWIEAHGLALAKFKESNDPHLAIEPLEETGLKDAWDKRPSGVKESAYVGLLNDYGFFLSETNDRYKDALPILKKVIGLDPKRHVAYLNLGDVYAKSLKETSDSKKQMELKQLVLKNYQEYARLLREKNPKAELPQRVRDALEAGKSK
jgi:tetratricopeptide (TPR) repeat protein